MRICLAQLNPTVGDVDGNAAKVLEAARAAAAGGADLVVFPELVISGYPAEDLWLKPHFVARCEAALARIAPELPVPCIVGCPRAEPGDGDGDGGGARGAVRNAAMVIIDRSIRATYDKQLLPNYDVFDEHRWFTAGDQPCVFDLPHAGGGDPVAVGVTICEDAWIEGAAGPVPQAAAHGAQVVVNLSASPWRLDREDVRERVVCERAREAGAWVVLCNQIGAQDELVFDGRSLAAAPDGTIIARGKAFAEDLVFADVGPGAGAERVAAFDAADEQELWSALMLGLRDYVAKNSFASVVLGLSGGIDSALVLALAVDALGGPDRVHALTMPSRWSSDGTRGDAHAQAERLGVAIHEVAIEPIVTAFEQQLAPVFVGAVRDVTEENLQARVRGTLLMAASNKHGHLLLATGNKSEGSVGYATLYGDMNGGFAPIKDVYKTQVFALARWRNAQAAAASEAPVIPPSVIERPPSAELAPDQTDEASLGDYDDLDAVLRLLVEEGLGIEAAAARGHEAAYVERIQRMLVRAEYKRRQAAPGTRVSGKAFGRDRRMPITNAFDGRAPQL